jgi:hypothetical protein
VVTVVSLGSSAAADPGQPQRDRGVTLGDASLSLTSAAGTDIAQGPPAELTRIPWLLPLPPTLSTGGAWPTSAPPLLLRLELPPLFGVPWYVRTTFAGSLRALGPSTELGSGAVLGPLQTGTQFSLSRDSAGLWVNNSSFVRYLAPSFDLGLETRNSYLLTTPRLERQAVEGSLGVRASADAPTVRVSSTLLPAAGQTWSSVNAFGSF